MAATAARIERLTHLAGDVTIKSGVTNLTAALPERCELSFTVTVPTLILKCSEFPGGQFELTPRHLPVVLGRSHSADITISDAQLSRRHAEIRMNAAGQFELVDLDSTNLSIVNTHDVTRHILSHGDQILLGDTELAVELRLPRSDIHDQTTRDLPMME